MFTNKEEKKRSLSVSDLPSKNEEKKRSLSVSDLLSRKDCEASHIKPFIDSANNSQSTPSAPDQAAITENTLFNFRRKLMNTPGNQLYQKELLLLREYIQVLEETGISKNNSQYFMESHFDSLVATCSEEILELLFPSRIKKKVSRLRWWGAAAEQSMEFFYLVLNTVGFSIALAAKLGLGSDHWLCCSLFSHCVDSIWNHQDSANSFIVAFHQWKKGEKTLGTANLINGLGLAVCTIIANLSVNYLMPAIIHLSSTAICGLLSYGLALSTVVPAIIENYVAYKYEKNIKLLEQKIVEIQQGCDPNSKTNLKKLFHLKRAKAIETAEYNQRLRSRDTLLACSVGMIAVAFISFAILSGATYGGLPTLLVIGYVMAIVAGALRQYVLSKCKKNDLKKIQTWAKDKNNDTNQENNNHEPVEKYSITSSLFGFFKPPKKSNEEYPRSLNTDVSQNFLRRQTT